MTMPILSKQKFAVVARFSLAGLLTASAGLLLSTGAGAEPPATVTGAVKAPQVSDAVKGTVQGGTMQEAPAVSGAGKPGGIVAATPISIPRPIKLDKLAPRQLPAAVAQRVQAARVSGAGSPNDIVQSGEVTGVHGNEVTLRVKYLYDRSRPAPVYAGAFIYDAQGESVNAGYKPAIAGRPNGFVDITLVLPDKPFRSNHIVAFFLESGRPVFMNARFRFPYTWNNGVLAEIKGEAVTLAQQQPAAVLQNKEEFCKEYARTAVDQYRVAMGNNLPGIVPPVWSDNDAHHYKWCLTASREDVRNGQHLRQSYLDQYLPATAPPLLPPVMGPVSTAPAGNVQENSSVAGAVKSLPNKQFDPGRGP